MDLTFLGTGSAYPSPTRGASCIVYRNEGVYWMFDCGEGSQIQIQKSSIRSGKISRIFITHLHGDHMFGLPGLLCTVSQKSSVEARDPVVLYGPVGLRRYLRTSLLLSQSQLGFDYVVHELLPVRDQLSDDLHGWPDDHHCDDRLHPNEKAGTTITADDNCVWSIFEDATHTVKASWLRHRVPSFGFAIQEKALPGKLDPAILKSKGVPPGPLYAKIKAGDAITSPSGEVIRPQDVLGPPRPGRLVALLGDSSDSHKMAALCAGADVIVHEATLEDEKEANALEKGHSTPGMAGRFAKGVGAKSLILTHFSQRYKAADHTQQSLSDEDSSVNILTEQAVAAFGGNRVTAADDFLTVSIPARQACASGT